MENTKLSLFDIQSYCESRGYKCSGRIESGKCRLLLFVDGKLQKEAELIEFSEIPAVMAKKYRAIHAYLIAKD